MPPETLFQFANPLAMTGWLALALSPLAPRLTNLYAGFVVPIILSVGYAALILAFWASAEGGYDSLPNVMRLFDSPHAALAGWVHFLAFDLFVGAWAARTARAEGMPHILMLPCLGLIFWFGPIGFLLFLALRAGLSLRTPKPVEA
ncbi:ABA4-like family protein [Hyphomonas sp.]|uniref:ABA4-like family protein n=1 Tax=Hyphomonas sp. TaxID=87 RepID=UPI00391ADF2E